MMTYEEYVKGRTSISASWEHVTKEGWLEYTRAEKAEAEVATLKERVAELEYALYAMAYCGEHYEDDGECCIYCGEIIGIHGDGCKVCKILDRVLSEGREVE